MRKLTYVAGLLLLSSVFSGCGLMEDAFKAGLLFALVIVAIVALIIWLARSIGRTIMKRYHLYFEESTSSVLES